jgi:glutamate synthase domain-containing protein 3
MTDGLAWDLNARTVRELNQFLHELENVLPGTPPPPPIRVHHPDGKHSIAVGVRVPIDIELLGDGGYFLAGMNQQARITVNGNVGWSVAENMMSGLVRVRGSASECAGASAHGGLLVIEGDASSRCGISLKGGEIVVGGDVGHMSAFMAQAGTLVVCGDAGPALGDSLYEAVIYVRGTIHGLGADAQEEPLTPTDVSRLARLLDRAELNHDPRTFKRVASARTLYHWHVDHAGAY